MKYFSTRGDPEELSFEDVRIFLLHKTTTHLPSQTVLTGLAPNGGLYIPTSIPRLPENWKNDWKDYSFVDLSVAVLSLYISRDELSEAELRSLVVKSYAGFRHPEVTPLKNLGDKKYVLELWHGPTWAFKDVALQLLGNLFEFFLNRRNEKNPEVNEKLTVVGATSGDTGRYTIRLRKWDYSEINLLALRFTASGIKPTSLSLFCIQKDVYLPSRKRK